MTRILPNAQIVRGTSCGLKTFAAGLASWMSGAQRVSRCVHGSRAFSLSLWCLLAVARRGDSGRIRTFLLVIPFLCMAVSAMNACSEGSGKGGGASVPVVGVEDKIPLPDMGPEELYPVVYETGVPIVRETDPDRTRVYVNIYRPRVEGRFPTLLEAIAYRREIIALGDAPDPKWLAKRGYVVILMDVRGTGSSQGGWGIFSDEEIEDVVWIIDHWIPQQSWSNGKVGMMGPSYMGVIQYLVAARSPSHLMAIFPGVSMADAYRDIFYQGGIFDQEFIFFWALATEGLALLPGTELLKDPISALKALYQHIIQIPELLTWLDMTTDQAFFDLRSPMSYWDVLARYPVFASAGWFCIFTRGSLLNHSNLQRETGQMPAGKQGVVAPKKILVGPWYHAQGALLMDTPSEVMHKRWFDWHLKADEDPLYSHYDILDPKYPVILYVMGAEKWRKEREWPLDRAKPVSFFLSGKDQKDDRNPSLNNGSLVWGDESDRVWDGAEAIQPTTLSHDPPHYAGQYSRSTCRWLVGLTSFHPGSEDERENEQETLTFSTGRLESDVEVTGPSVLRFWARTRFEPVMQEARRKLEELGAETGGVFSSLIDGMGERDVHWIVNLNDVFPDGRVRNLTSGWLAASHRPDPLRPDWTQDGYDPLDYPEDRSPSPPEDGEIYEYVVEIWPTCNVFLAGHQIRIDLVNSDYPHLLPSLVPCRSEILHDLEHPSRLILPVVEPDTTDPTLWIQKPRAYLAGDIPWDPP